MKNKNNLIIKIVLILCALVFVGTLIYSYFKIEDTKEDTYKDNIFTYLTSTNKNDELASSSALLGLLNYNFNDITTSLSTSELIKTNLMTNSKMNSIGVDNIYMNIYNVNKTDFLNKSNYVNNKVNNCYSYKNIDCKQICSLSTENTMKQINKLLKWDNVLPDDAKTFCIENPVYLLEGDGYFVNLSEVKKLYNTLTGKELTFDSEIVNNKYYKYDAYLVTSRERIDDAIIDIVSVDEVKKEKELFIVTYTATSEKENNLKGKVSLKEENDTFYIVSNEINTSNYLK